jgi:transposase
MVEALIAGESDPDQLAQLAHRRIKASPEALREALRGRVTQRHRFLLRLHLQQIDAIDRAVEEIDQKVRRRCRAFRGAIALLTTTPGVSVLSAEIILAEIGRDMRRFPTAGHLISWAGLCPKNDESPAGQARGLKAHGKRRSTRMRKGAPGSRPPSSNAPGPCLAKRPAISRPSFTDCAPAASILTTVYHMLISGELYHDLGPDHFDRRAKARQTSRLVTRLQHLGYAVQITPLAA